MRLYQQRHHAPTQRTITVWPSDAVPTLQDCFQCTDWQIFREAAVHDGEVDLEDYTAAVLGYIEVRSLLEARDAAFRSGERVALGVARRKLNAGVKRATAAYTRRIQGQFSSIREILRPLRRSEHPSTRLAPPPGEELLSVTTAEVRRTLQRINPRKAAGPDNIPGRLLRDCTHQLTEALTDIFNTSLQQATVPTFLKTATIIPIPKPSTVTGLNDYRPVALTLIVMKCFERLVMVHIKDSIDVTEDPHKYAYRNKKSTEDAISSVVHTTLTHLEEKDSYVRLLFVDFTSAFNTIRLQSLIQKLNILGLRSTLCNLDFLSVCLPQSVRIHGVSSSSVTLSTGWRDSSGSDLQLQIPGSTHLQ
ncbi:uncharacterized protein LOC112486372 isoform X2 [Cynoglossus semilaevis]|uniref:uncharacterized protein LOC112486372 isoform X2 n=1 Tax=Cynoglossus semilaevis TaxID=244447 RepID=UPI000D62AF8E|nr:uncharacterized protein LOC112486372 isoform X2 [Cynoglossus semilaevis]